MKDTFKIALIYLIVLYMLGISDTIGTRLAVAEIAVVPILFTLIMSFQRKESWTRTR